MNYLVRLPVIALRILLSEGWTSLWYKGQIWLRQQNRSLNPGNPFIDPYKRWIKENEPDKYTLEQQRKTSSSFEYRPKISIIMPVWNSNKKYLIAAIESVLHQTYDNWELCIADGDSTYLHVKQILNQYQNQDSRIKTAFLTHNGGISVNSNEALKLATGEFICFLDHDDTLAPFAFHEIAQLLNTKKEADLIYSDEDKIVDSNNSRFAPLFKPDWSPELLISCNYLTHVTIIRKKLIDQVGGFISEFDGAQDWDLFLRITEQTKNIYHIPKILYHWRASDKSCAMDLANKTYALDAQLNVLKAHFKRLQIPVTITWSNGIIKVNHYIPDTKVSVIITTRDNASLLKRCLSSLLSWNTHKNIEIIIVDTGSIEDETLTYYDGLKSNAKIIRIDFKEIAADYWASRYAGVQIATGEALLFLDDSIELTDPGAISEMLGWTIQKDIGIVGAKIFNPENRIQHAGLIIGLNGYAGDIFSGVNEGYYSIFGSTEWYRNYQAVTSSCLMMRKDIFNKESNPKKLFDKEVADIELCLNTWKSGYRIMYTPFARFKNNIKCEDRANRKQKSFQMTYELLKPHIYSDDPFFNINLSYKGNTPNLIIEKKDHNPISLNT